MNRAGVKRFLALNIVMIVVLSIVAFADFTCTLSASQVRGDGKSLVDVTADSDITQYSLFQMSNVSYNCSGHGVLNSGNPDGKYYDFFETAPLEDSEYKLCLYAVHGNESASCDTVVSYVVGEESIAVGGSEGTTSEGDSDDGEEDEGNSMLPWLIGAGAGLLGLLAMKMAGGNRGNNNTQDGCSGGQCGTDESSGGQAPRASPSRRAPSGRATPEETEEAQEKCSDLAKEAETPEGVSQESIDKAEESLDKLAPLPDAKDVVETDIGLNGSEIDKIMSDEIAKWDSDLDKLSTDNLIPDICQIYYLDGTAQKRIASLTEADYSALVSGGNNPKLLNIFSSEHIMQRGESDFVPGNPDKWFFECDDKFCPSSNETTEDKIADCGEDKCPSPCSEGEKVCGGPDKKETSEDIPKLTEDQPTVEEPTPEEVLAQAGKAEETLPPVFEKTPDSVFFGTKDELIGKGQDGLTEMVEGALDGLEVGQGRVFVTEVDDKGTISAVEMKRTPNTWLGKTYVIRSIVNDEQGNPSYIREDYMSEGGGMYPSTIVSGKLGPFGSGKGLYYNLEKEMREGNQYQVRTPKEYDSIEGYVQQNLGATGLPVQKYIKGEPTTGNVVAVDSMITGRATTKVMCTIDGDCSTIPVDDISPNVGEGENETTPLQNKDNTCGHGCCEITFGNDFDKNKKKYGQELANLCSTDPNSGCCENVERNTVDKINKLNEGIEGYQQLNYKKQGAKSSQEVDSGCGVAYDIAKNECETLSNLFDKSLQVAKIRKAKGEATLTIARDMKKEIDGLVKNHNQKVSQELNKCRNECKKVNKECREGTENCAKDALTKTNNWITNIQNPVYTKTVPIKEVKGEIKGMNWEQLGCYDSSKGMNRVAMDKEQYDALGGGCEGELMKSDFLNNYHTPEEIEAKLLDEDFIPSSDNKLLNRQLTPAAMAKRIEIGGEDNPLSYNLLNREDNGELYKDQGVQKALVSRFQDEGLKGHYSEGLKDNNNVWKGLDEYRKVAGVDPSHKKLLDDEFARRRALAEGRVQAPIRREAIEEAPSEKKPDMPSADELSEIAEDMEEEMSSTSQEVYSSEAANIQGYESLGDGYFHADVGKGGGKNVKYIHTARLAEVSKGQRVEVRVTEPSWCGYCRIDAEYPYSLTLSQARALGAPVSGVPSSIYVQDGRYVGMEQ